MSSGEGDGHAQGERNGEAVVAQSKFKQTMHKVKSTLPILIYLLLELLPAGEPNEVSLRVHNLHVAQLMQILTTAGRVPSHLLEMKERVKQCATKCFRRCKFIRDSASVLAIGGGMHLYCSSLLRINPEGEDGWWPTFAKALRKEITNKRNYQSNHIKDVLRSKCLWSYHCCFDDLHN